VLFTHNDQAGFRKAFHQVREQRAGGRLGGMRIDYEDLCLRRFEAAKIGSQGRFQLSGNDFEIGLSKNSLKLAEHQRMGRENANA